jgi:ComF family protein
MSVLEAAIGWLAPSTCIGCGVEGIALCIACSSSEILPFGERCFGCGSLSSRSKTCKTCRAKNAPNYVWVSTDYEGLAKNLVQRFKFEHNRASAGSISQLMAGTFLSQNSDKQIASKNYLIIPVPTAGARVRQRGFDHTSLLAKSLSRRLALSIENALGRLGSSQQVGAPRRLRAAQVKNAYYAKKHDKIKGRNILLIDDVVTTGATLSEAARELRQSGARSVDALVFAKRL